MTKVGVLAVVLVAVGMAGVLWLVWVWVRGQRRGPASPREAYAQGLSALIGGNRREAILRFKEAVQGDSENIDAYLRLGDLLRENGDIQKALSVHRDLTVRPRLLDPDRVRILESLTRDYLAAARFEEAGQSAERLRHIDRASRFAHRALQQVAEALGDWPRALRVVEERVKLEGSKDKGLLARYHGFVGGEELSAGRTKEARQHFEEALKLDPDCLLALLYLGDMEHAQGNTEKAIESWRDLAFRAPDHGGLVFDRLERAFFETGHFGEVVPFYRELLHRAPREAAVPALLALAEIHRRKGDLDEAETFLHEALEIEPDHPRAHRHLVKLALDRRDAPAALAQVDRLLETLAEDTWKGSCHHCGHVLAQPIWRCPDCKSLNPLDL